MRGILDSILCTVGNTPLVKINKIFRKKGVHLLAKLEFFNPLGSIKDRIAVAMIEEAEKSGELTKNKIIIESSSGNTGIAVAMISAVKGYRCVITMPRYVSIERRKILKALGVELVLVEGGIDDAIEEADRIYRTNPEKYCRINQYSSFANTECHYATTGPEIWQQTEGKITHLVAGMGTTGTVCGVGKFLKEKKPDVKVIAIQPMPKHNQQGMKNMDIEKIPVIFEPDFIDEIITTTDQQAYQTSRLLARQEGIFAGISAGSVMYGAIQVANKINEGVVVVILADHGFKYLSTPLFEEVQDDKNKTPPIS
jgi:cysteine synthase